MNGKNGNAEVPVGQASAKAGVSQRTLYNWIKTKKLAARTENGTTIVDVDAVRALVSRRTGATANTSAIAGSSAGNGTGMANGTPSPAGDGDLTAQTFAAFKQNVALEDVIERLKIPAATALALYRQFEEVRAVGARTGPTIADRVAAAEATLTQLATSLDMATEGATLSSQLRTIAADVAELREYIRGLVGPHRSGFSCTCGAKGYAAVEVACTCCGRTQKWGFHPPQR